MTDYGLKISKEGYDVKSASDENLVYSSEFDNLIRKTTGTTIVSSGTTTIAHGLAYEPVFFALFSRDDDRFKMGYGGVDSSNIALSYMGNTTYWRYYLFYHTGA